MTTSIAPSPPAALGARTALAGGLPHSGLQATALGSVGFRREYGIRLAYLSGAMYRGIASVELVAAMANAGLLGFFGTGGLSLDRIEEAILNIRARTQGQAVFGMNLLHNLERPDLELQSVELFLRHRIRFVEAAAFMQITPALVLYRVKGLSADRNGEVLAANRILAKISRPEVAAVFMQPPPQRILQQLLESGKITHAEAQLASQLPMAGEFCVESDSAGHTDRGVALTLLPSMLDLRQEMKRRFHYRDPIYIGAAGGIGSPQAAAASFILGADFIMTGSVNQCTVEAGISDAVKDLLQDIGVEDTTYAPAGDMFELGAKIQVVRKGLLFAARANKLYELYQRHHSLDDIDAATQTQIQQRFLQRTFAQVWEETRAYYLRSNPRKVQEAEASPKQKMALIFRWYFTHSSRLALAGDVKHKVDFQVHCGPALGAFNHWVKGTELESWRRRHVAQIAQLLMTETARFLETRFALLGSTENAAA